MALTADPTNDGEARVRTPKARRMRRTFGVVAAALTVGAMFLFGPPGWPGSALVGGLGAGVAAWWAVGVAIRRRGS